MNPRLFLSFFIFIFISPWVRAEIAWQTDYDAALASAAETGKPILLDFSASWCGPCKMMEAKTFTDATVQEVLAGYIAVKVDFDKNPKLVGQYRVSAIPHLVILNRFGESVASQTGYQDAARFNGWLASQQDAAFAKTSKLQAAKAMTDALDKDLQSPEPAVRERSLAMLIESYLSKDEFAKASEKMLKDLVDQKPDEMLPRLNDSHLAIRILLANQFAQKLGPKFAFDPWATAEEREAAVKALGK